MGSGFASCFLLFYTLLVLQDARGRSLQKNTRSNDFLQISDSNQGSEYAQKGLRRSHVQKFHDHPSSHMKEMDPELNIFFTVEDLRIGKTIPIYFSTKDSSSSPHLLTREEADSIPFSSSQLPYLLKFFSFSEDSPQAKAIENTLRQCELEPVRGETTFCATSLESMLDSTRGIFGMENKFKVLTTTLVDESSANILQNYTILGIPKEISAPKMVGCHMMPYPYAVYYCHSQESGNKLFQVSLVGENGGRIEAPAVCHVDTSQWEPDHVAFRILRIRPGSSPVCHFFPADNLVWFPVSMP